MSKVKYTSNKKRYATKRTFIQKLFGYCPYCGNFFQWPITTTRRYTEYDDPKDNYLTACPDCHDRDDIENDELWLWRY